MIHLPLPVPLPSHALRELAPEMIPEDGVTAPECQSGLVAAQERLLRPPEHAAVHPVGRIGLGPQALSEARLLAITDNAVLVADIALGNVASLTGSPRVKTQKAALGGLHATD